MIDLLLKLQSKQEEVKKRASNSFEKLKKEHFPKGIKVDQEELMTFGLKVLFLGICIGVFVCVFIVLIIYK